jgi:hypothetical protein
MGHEPPGNLSHLQRLANAAATRDGIAVGRYQRWINVQIVSAALSRVRDANGDVEVAATALREFITEIDGTTTSDE